MIELTLQNNEQECNLIKQKYNMFYDYIKSIVFKHANNNYKEVIPSIEFIIKYPMEFKPELVDLAYNAFSTSFDEIMRTIKDEIMMEGSEW